jgi:hypothetical protein
MSMDIRHEHRPPGSVDEEGSLLLLVLTAFALGGAAKLMIRRLPRFRPKAFIANEQKTSFL